MNREFRIVGDAECRVKPDGKTIEGYAAIFNRLSANLGGFREKVSPGAFTRAINENQDVRALFNHDMNYVLGRRGNGTLKLSQDSTGLAYEVVPPETRRDVLELIERRDITGCSFSFIVGRDGQKWTAGTKEDSALSMRDLTDISVLQDVGPVLYPAYEQTSVDVRSLWPDGVPSEITQNVPTAVEEREKVTAPAIDETKSLDQNGAHESKIKEMRAQFDADIKKAESSLALTQKELTEARAALASEKDSQAVWLKRLTTELEPTITLFDSLVNEIVRRRRVEGDSETLAAQLSAIQTQLSDAHALIVSDKNTHSAWMQRVSADLDPAAKSLRSALSEMVRRVRLATID